MQSTINKEAINLSNDINIDSQASVITNPDKDNLPKFFDSEDNLDQRTFYYEKVLDVKVHPTVSYFFGLDNQTIALRYCHLNSSVLYEKLIELLNYQPVYFRWAGCDLFNCIDKISGKRSMVVVETNSCPSGIKSMPFINDGYKRVMEVAFVPTIKDTNKNEGSLAVVFDKNRMEATAYCATLSKLTKERVYLVDYQKNEVIWKNNKMHVKSKNKTKIEWIPIRACFRYVTQKPWTKIPLNSNTRITNSIVACLAGGRNKMMADIAYENLNEEIKEYGLNIKTPNTIRNVTLQNVRRIVEDMNYIAVIKNPYSNAGQGVYTITNKKEIDEFMELKHGYNKFIVQSLVGNSNWSSKSLNGKEYYHSATMPTNSNKIFVSDIRIMVVADHNGFKPSSMYARRARTNLIHDLPENKKECSWDMLGTNLSIKKAENKNCIKWDTDHSRLLHMDTENFNSLALGLDDLIEGYIQTVLSVIAIDKMSLKLMSKNGNNNIDNFDYEMFEKLNPDKILVNEISQFNKDK